MKDVGGQPFHAVGDKYVRALAEVAGVQPVILPNLDEFVDARSLLPLLDGLMLTGSPSNVHPSHYGTDQSAEHEPHDPARDAVTLPLIRAALDEGVPLLAICRGFQELNVVLGGTLHPAVHHIEGRMDHRSPQTGTMARDYAPRHPLALTPGGRLAAILGTDSIEVNSLHRQAIDRLAEGLAVEGTAPDGTIEAISVKGARGFTLGVQWHPEYCAIDNPDSVKLFRAFGAAVAERHRQRLRAAA
jgi:putative glutamine amidotransferase